MLPYELLIGSGLSMGPYIEMSKVLPEIPGLPTAPPIILNNSLRLRCPVFYLVI